MIQELLTRHKKVLIGVVHLQPLPGAPEWRGNLDAVLKFAVRDAEAYARGGAHAVFIENFGDIPFTKGSVGPETVASMAAAGRAIRQAIDLPIGFNVLRNDGRSALALCAACGGSFVRINVHTGAMLTDQGIIEGNAYETLRYKKTIAPEAEIFADVHVKHAVPLGPWTIGDSARDAVERGRVDALIVSGRGTGLQTAISDVEEVRATVPRIPLLIGSGITSANVKDYMRVADGCIVGSSLKRDGGIYNNVDSRKVAALARALRA